MSKHSTDGFRRAVGSIPTVAEAVLPAAAEMLDIPEGEVDHFDNTDDTSGCRR